MRVKYLYSWLSSKSGFDPSQLEETVISCKEAGLEIKQVYKSYTAHLSSKKV